MPEPTAASAAACSGVPHVIGWLVVEGQFKYLCARCGEHFTLARGDSEAGAS